MNRTPIAVLVLAALGVGYLVGSLSASAPGEGGLSSSAEVAVLREECERLRMALGGRGPRLDPGAALAGRGGGPTPPDEISTAAGRERGEVVERYDITEFKNAEDAFRQLLAYAATMLARGEEGHLELLETLSRNFYRKPGERITGQLVGSEEQAARFLYPLLRFALNHDAEVAAMTETVFRVLAEEPQRLAKVDGDALELFTEGVAYMMPGMVGPKRLAKLQGHARAILAVPAEDQPDVVQRVRQDIQRALGSWAPVLTREDALALLQSGKASPEQMVAAFERLDPATLQRLDIDAVLGPLLEKNVFSVLSMLGRIELDAVTRSKLDQRMIRSTLVHPGQGRLVRFYLQFTGRRTWAGARDFIEAGLQQAGGEKAWGFVRAALGLRKGPDADWIRWALETYTFPEVLRKELEAELR